MKKIEELTDDEIARVRAQQAPCHFGNCTAKVRAQSATNYDVIKAEYDVSLAKLERRKFLYLGVFVDRVARCGR